MKRLAALFLFVLVSLLTLVTAISCTNNSPNSAFISPVKTISASNPSWTPTPTFTFTTTPTPTPAFPVAGFSGPFALAIDSKGNEYVGDTGNNMIRQYVAGVPNTSWPNGKVKAYGLSYTSPKAIAVDSSNNLYVVGNGNAVSKYSSNGDFAVQLTPATGNLSSPQGVACAGTTLYVSDTGNQQILMFNTTSGASTTITQSPPLAYTPYGLATNSTGSTIYVAGSDGYVHLYTSAGAAGAPASIAGFNSPYAVALDSSNDLYVSDTGNHQIEEFSSTGLSSGPINIFGTGTLNAPEGIVVDTSGNIYTVDSANNLFYEFVP